jgi:hypothetical protein
MLGITGKLQAGISLEIRATKHNVQRYMDGQISHLLSFVKRNLDLQERGWLLPSCATELRIRGRILLSSLVL